MSILETFAASHKLHPAQWGRAPTPLEPRPDIGRDLGVELFIKREDMLDDFGCGHKVRKVAYYLTDACQRNATVVITPGSVQSNQCRAVAIGAKRHGLKAHLVYCGDEQIKPSTPTGNYLLTALFEPVISWYERRPWREVEQAVEEVRQQELNKGELPYIIPPGASKWPGLLGSVALGHELVTQVRSMGFSPEYIVAAAGSGGTCIGIKVAARLMGLDCKVFGICVAGLVSQSEHEQELLLRQASIETAIPEIMDCRVEFHAGARGGGYDVHLPEELDSLAEIALRYQVLFDPNYMLRAFRGLRQLIELGSIEQGKTVILIHTGGQFGVFAGNPSLLTYWRARMRDALQQDG